MEKKISTNDISEKDSIKYYLAIFIISSIYAMIVTLTTTMSGQPNNIAWS